MPLGPPRLRPYQADDLPAVVAVWRASKRDAYPFLPLEQSYTLDDDTGFFREHIAPRCHIELAEADGEVVGYLAMRGSYIDRLYVSPRFQNRGVGTLLLERARSLSPGHLELHTHVQNFIARAFYEKHGFDAVKFGFSPPPERAPDVEYHWHAPRSMS